MGWKRLFIFIGFVTAFVLLLSLFQKQQQGAALPSRIKAEASKAVEKKVVSSPDPFDKQKERAIDFAPEKRDVKAQTAFAVPAERQVRNTKATSLPMVSNIDQIKKEGETASESMAATALLESMRTTVREFGLRFGGNPVGTNAEITKALGGDNPKHVNFLDGRGYQVNEKGELVDHWGTPLFFHQISGMEMEVRSAGPDRKMWTSDDIVTR